MKINTVIIIWSVLLVSAIVDLLFTHTIMWWVDIILATTFTILFIYFDNVRKTHMCTFDISIMDKYVNENTRDITSKCKCGKINTQNVHKDSVSYQKFIKNK